MKLLLPFLFALIPAILWADRAGPSKFGGLHNSDASILIGDSEAQDLLNVDITDSGLGVKKRSGYSQFKTVGVSTIGVRGGYYFRDASGNDNLIAANNQSVYYSRAGGNYTAFITTDTAGSYYDFTDSNGSLWRANSNRNQICKWDGTTLTYYPSHPFGNQIEALPDRLVISGVSANPNRVYFSHQADFTTFTTGTDEDDPWYDDIGLPGQSVNAIKTACGGVLAWTKDSTFFGSGTNQFDWRWDLISPNIGTLQPNSVIQDGANTFWQAQDKKVYGFDCNTITEISQNIDISDFAGGESKQWELSSASDWNSGTLESVSSSTSVGDILLSTWTATDTTTADFTLGTASNVTVTGNSVYLSTNNVSIDNPGFESGTTALVSDNWTGWDGSSFRPNTSYKRSGSYSACKMVSVFGYVFIYDKDGNILTYATPSGTAGVWVQNSIDLSSYAGRWIYIHVSNSINNPPSSGIRSDTFLCSGGTLTYYYWLSNGCVDDFAGGRSTTYSGTFTSQSFDTSFSSPAWLSSDATWTTNDHSITMQTQSSDDGVTWDAAVTWSTGSAPASAWKQSIRYVATISTGGTTNGTGLPHLDDVTLSARSSSGTWTSPTKEIGGNATAFRNLSVDETLNGGTIGYFIRSTTTEAGLPSTPWTSMTKDTQISATIASWIQVKSTFTITTATFTPTLSSLSVTYDEGTITRTFGSVDKDHRLIWSVAEGTATVPSVSYIYDQRFASWLKYGFPFDAPTRAGDSIYFGNPASGTVYSWPSGNMDAGSAITSYWKSKDFIGGDPFCEKDFFSYNFIGKAQTGSNLDITYTLNGNTSGTLTNYSLTDSNDYYYRRINQFLPSGTFGTMINWKFGNDDADAPFELYGFTFDYKPRSWRVMP